jgi:hypothetical protein
MPRRRLVSRAGAWLARLMVAVFLASPLRAEQAAAPSSGDSESATDLAKKTY